MRKDRKQVEAVITLGNFLAWLDPFTPYTILELQEPNSHSNEGNSKSTLVFRD